MLVVYLCDSKDPGGCFVTKMDGYFNLALSTKQYRELDEFGAMSPSESQWLVPGTWDWNGEPLIDYGDLY